MKRKIGDYVIDADNRTSVKIVSIDDAQCPTVYAVVDNGGVHYNLSEDDIVVTLNEHLNNIDQNKMADEDNISTLCDSIWRKKIFHKNFPSKNFTRKKNTFMPLIEEYVHMIFETQDYRCTHWIKVNENQLNGVWNRPGKAFNNWKSHTILYELDHVVPVNAGGKLTLDNIQFLSSNANQFVKCSLTYDDLLMRVDLSEALKNRIIDVLDRRRLLFSSDKWGKFISSILAS